MGCDQGGLGGRGRGCVGANKEEGTGEISEAAKVIDSEGQESDMVGVKVGDEEGGINV